MINVKAKKQYLTFKEAAAEYNISVSCLRRATKDETHPLPYCRPRGQSRGFTLYRPALERWLQECMVYTGATA